MVGLPRYPSDLTDAPGALVEPLRPPLSKDGRRAKHGRRDLVDATCYVDRTGCACRALQVDFPPWQTMSGSFTCWQATGVTKGLPDGLRGRLPAAEGRHADPTAGVIDS